MRVFVAGATGVLGFATVRRMVAGGHQVTGTARTAERRRALGELGARAVDADLFDRAATRAAIEGNDVVCNLATRIPVGRRLGRASAWRENDRLWSEASAMLADAAADCGALRFIQESVALVYADGGDDWITERSPLAPTPRTQSSLAATDNAMAFADQYRFAVVLRFGSIYGADANTRWQLDRVRHGKAVLSGDPAAYIAPITVEDAAAAVVASLAAPSGIYNVAATPVRRREWARALGTAAGIDGSAKFQGGLAHGLFNGRQTETAARSLRISSDAFHMATGWRARTALAEGLAPACVGV